MRTEQETNVLLASVSRSFYLTIRALPKPLRRPIRTAYLLARATDTIADTVEIPSADRQKHLRSLRQVILDEASPEDVLKLCIEVTPRQSNSAEKFLITQLPEILEDYQSMEAADHADVSWVLEQITTGQEEDLLNSHLTTDAALERYTWLVAGCVGEFWTRLCARKLRKFSEESTEEMLVLGADFGKGLQLVNILRDIPEDLANGRCYLPDLAEFPKWRERAATLLENGWRYVLALRSWRLRFACALPILIGKRTLALLGNTAPTSRIKVSRKEIRSLVFQVALRSGSRRWLGNYGKRETGR